MKKIFLTAVALVVFFIPASGMAKTYKIRPGDCLSVIASRFNTSVRELAKINRIGNPNLIIAGAALEIPEKANGKAISASPKPFFWKKANSNPFGSRNWEIIVNKFSLPEEVKKGLIEKVKNNEFSWNRNLKRGDKFMQMAFGNYKVVNNVIADWEEGKLEAARLYKIRYEDRIYYLADPLVCRNWCWWSEERIITPRPKPKKLLLLTPPSVEGQPTVAASLERKEKAKHICRPDWEAWAYAGIYNGAQKENRHDWSSYYGFNASFFPCPLRLGNGILRAGPAVQYVGWKGEAGEAVNYDGHMNLLGGEVQYITGSTKTQIKVYGGEKHGNVSGKGFPYKSRQKNDIIAIEPCHEWWYANRKWFPEIEAGGRAEIDLEGKRRSKWEGEPIHDPADNQHYYGLRTKAEIYRGKYATPTAELTAGYRGFDQSYHLEPRLGVKWWRDLAETDVSYNWVEHKQNNMAGAHLIINVSDGVKRLYHCLKAKKAESGETRKPEPANGKGCAPGHGGWN